ncbi:hypothetical protein glysoja_040213, partial [Glycine soja]
VKSVGSIKHEREALLPINSAYFDNNLPWVNNNITNYCEWDRVECNATTSRVAKLDLSHASDPHVGFSWCLNYSHFLVFEDIRNLNLS